MATKKQNREMNIIEIDPFDSTVVAEVTSTEATEDSQAKFQTYNWWLDTVTDESWAYFKDAFTAEEVAKIISIGQGSTSTALAEDIKRGKNTRSSIRSDLPNNQWIFQRLVNVITHVNRQFFNYDISYIDNLQFVAASKTQDVSGKYTDSELFSIGTKKLSFIVQLTENDAYEGGDILLHNSDNPTSLPREQGTVDIFPAFTLREMTPVTKGTNYVLVGSVIGPRFK